MKIYTIHLIRHGLTEGNIHGVYVGSMDMPLCGRGRKELIEFKSKYKYPESDVIFSSPLKRCVETAEILYGRKPAVIPDLREYSFGEYEGKKAVDLQDEKGFKEWLNGRMEVAAPGGESGEQFRERIGKAFTLLTEGLLRTDTRNAVVISHGGVITNLLAMFGYPQKDAFHWMMNNGSGFTIHTDLRSWMRANLFEVGEMIPKGKEDILIRADKWFKTK